MRLLCIGLVIILTGCKSPIAREDLSNLNGYWEIEKVTFSDGSTKEYTVNLTIDYIEIDGLKGYRKKVQPTFNGTYTTTNDAAFFEVLENEGIFEIYYKNELSEWKEQLVDLSEINFSVVNNKNITYTYKRFQPINPKD